MIKAIVTDIEGTTTSLSFVKDVLFPYARRHIAEYVLQHAAEPDIAKSLDDVRGIVGGDPGLQKIANQLEKWIDEDKKITPLKALQGLLWETGYKQGDFTGHIYADAKEQLETWQVQGILIYVYSSGSVYAQKLLFGHTEYGDLNGLFSGYFDTRVGAKTDIESYKQIARTIGLEPDEILFLSDIEAELDAAKQAGMETCWLVRDGQIDLSARHRQVADFGAIDPAAR